MDLATPVLIDIARLKEGWMFVGSAFQKGSPHCDECGYCDHKGQMLPYGEGVAYEAWKECSLGRRPYERPTDCPAYQEHLQEQAEEEEQ